MTASCWLRHRFEYTRESAGEEKKAIFLFLAFGIPNNRLDTDTQHFVIIITSAKERVTIIIIS